MNEQKRIPTGLSEISEDQRFHLRVEIGFPFKPYSRQIRHGDVAALDPHAVGKSPIGLEKVRVRLVSAEAQAGSDIQRHLMSAMWNTAACRPALTAEHVENAQILHQSVAERRIELKPVNF